MTEEIVARLTELTGYRPPADYLDAVKNYPEVLKHARRAMDDSDAEGTVADVEFMNSLESVLALNCEARSDALMRPDGIEQLWPDQFLIIGETGSGDYYCIDMCGEVDGVMQYNHQEVQWHVCEDSLEEFVEMLVDVFMECESEDDGIVPEEGS